MLATCFPWVSKQFARTFSRHSEFYLFSSQNCLHTCFCICGHQICGSSGLWVPVRCSVSQGAQSSMKMLCFQLDGLLQRTRDPERMIPSVALQHLISAWRAAFWERFHSSLISPQETGWLIGWMSSFLPKRDSRASPATRSSLRGALPGSFKRTSLVFLSSFNECWNILMTFSVMCDVLTFLTKWLWTHMHSQPKSPEVLAGSIFMWGGAEGFIFCCLDDHVVPF